MNNAAILELSGPQTCSRQPQSGMPIACCLLPYAYLWLNAIADCAFALKHFKHWTVFGRNSSVAALTQLPALLPAQTDTFLYRIHMSPAFTETQVSFTSLLTGMRNTCQELLLPSNGYFVQVGKTTAVA